MKTYLCKTCGETNVERFYVGNKSKCKCCILGISIEEYNPHSVVREKNKYHCRICGETDEQKFYINNKSECKCCLSDSKKKYNPHKTTVVSDEQGNRIKIHKCHVCGETDKEKFNPSSKGMCKTCQNERNKKIFAAKYVPKERQSRLGISYKPFKCHICGETDEKKFNKGSKGTCGVCQYLSDKHKTKNPEEILKLIEDKKLIKSKVKVWLCETCGETHVERFRKNNRKKCKSCLSVKPNGIAKFREIKVHLCETCGETNPEMFYAKRKCMCHTCQLELSRSKRCNVKKLKPIKIKPIKIRKIKEKKVTKPKYINLNVLKRIIGKRLKVIKVKIEDANDLFQDYKEKIESYNNGSIEVIKKKRKSLFVYRNNDKFYPCKIHGEVKVGNSRNFIKGCPTCNIENYCAKLPVYASYEEAKNRTRKFGISSSKEYRLWIKRTCQDDLPSSPEVIYKDNGWVDYYEFLGTDRFGRMSGGERRIYQFLEKKGLEFQWQKKFDDCRNINCLVFDFYIPKYNVIIEYDGEQHFKMSNFSRSVEVNMKKFEQVQKNDKIKTKYCQDKNITLIRLDTYHLVNNLIEWELDVELTTIAANIAISTL
jgi:very-short-patch-repair endonuclease